MTMNEWKKMWVDEVVKAGVSLYTALDTYTALYGRDGPDLNKNPKIEASSLLCKLETQ